MEEKELTKEELIEWIQQHFSIFVTSNTGGDMDHYNELDQSFYIWDTPERHIRDIYQDLLSFCQDKIIKFEINIYPDPCFSNLTHVSISDLA